MQCVSCFLCICFSVHSAVIKFNALNFLPFFAPNFQVSTIVQVVGFSLSLHAATRISHRAQGIASVASRWHALVTCSSNETSQNRNSNSALNLEAANRLNSLHISYSESDLESVDYVAMPTNTQLASYMSSYHRRQAFGNILQLIRIKIALCFL